MGVVKKVVKKPVKKVVKKPINKPIKKPVKRGAKGVVARGRDRSRVDGRNVAGEYATSIIKIAQFGGDAVKGYGGGNGEALLSPTVLIGGGLWVLVLLRFVLFYGFFGE